MHGSWWQIICVDFDRHSFAVGGDCAAEEFAGGVVCAEDLMVIGGRVGLCSQSFSTSSTFPAL